MHRIRVLWERIRELEEHLEISERKADILTNLLKEANAEFERALTLISNSEKNFRAVFQSAPEAIYIIDSETRQIIDCNSYIIEWLGYAREELLSMRLDDLVPVGGHDIPDNIRRAVEHGFVRVQERKYLKKDGTIVDAEVTGTVIEYEDRRCLAILVRDVGERKQLEELSRYKELFETVGDPVFINDYEGKLLEANEGACTASGYTRDELLAMSVKDLAGTDSKQGLTAALTALQTEETVKFELDMITRSQESVPFEIHARTVNYLGKPAVLSVARDLTVRKKLERTLIRTERLTAVGEMASGVAHNFNNLLQMIIGASQAASAKLEAGSVDQCKEALDAILTSCDRGADIVRRIKEFTHAEAHSVCEASVFDLSDLVREAVELAKPMWADPCDPSKYELEVSNPTAAYVKGRPSEVYEVLVNLIRNALEAMPEGGVLAISVETDDSEVRLTVSDTGVGIDRENLQRVFEPFFTTKGLKSSGLGLSSSYGIIKKHGGEIQVQSTPEEGTTFLVTLPAAIEQETDRALRTVAADGPEINLLVIDDEAHILRAMEMFFEDSEIRIHTAGSGPDGLRTYRRGGIDAVLCDLGMDEMSGWDIGKVIKDFCHERGIPKTPFIVYTGWDNGIESARLEEHGVDRVVTKPIRMENLQRIVRELVSVSESTL